MQKKTIKIKFIGFWKTFDPSEYPFFQTMKKYYDVVETDNADYIICSVFGEKYEYCKYPQVRIMFSGENYSPDFNLIDYAISPYPIQYLDRHFYLPNCIDKYHRCEELEFRERNFDQSFLETKQYFANFIASHESEDNIRGDFFKKLCEYKRVESVGTYLNNMPNGLVVDFENNSKTDFQRKCKFTLCFESTKHEGFVTEKITDAFYADTIPVYFGSDTAKEMFNPKAYIHVSDYPSFDDAIAKIIELDSNDDKYLEMMNEPIFQPDFSPKRVLEEQEAFIRNIFDQPIENAYRRSRVFWPHRFNGFLTEAKRPENIPIKQLVNLIRKRIVSKFKKMVFNYGNRSNCPRISS